MKAYKQDQESYKPNRVGHCITRQMLLVLMGTLTGRLSYPVHYRIKDGITDYINGEIQQRNKLLELCKCINGNYHGCQITIPNFILRTNPLDGDDRDDLKLYQTTTIRRRAN